MDAEWKLLVQLGLPRGMAHPLQSSILGNAAALRQAVESLAAQRLEPTDNDVLAAWLAGFKHHWPSAFTEVLGEVGELSLQALMPRIEPNRYLKLRRIAIANLATVL